MKYYEGVTIVTYIPVIVAFIGFLLCYRTLGSTLKVFSWFIFLSGIIQFSSLIIWYKGKNNMPLLHIYVVGGFLCLAWFYRSVLGHFIRPSVIWGIAILFTLFSIANTIFFQPLHKFNSYALLAESALVIILSLFTFLFLLNHTIREEGIPDMQSITWINSGLFIYFLCCFLLYYFSNIMITHFTLGLRRVAWMFHSFFSVVMYSCFIVGLWKRSKIPD